ncbi:class I SAM-dependent methyltransferase [uncultured Sphingomonas sp.]|uniref:class I SAM-dependent methyltransferase n=1 Tax=uncultured Sphingomonas sp. TaxID=158754 RepID=UPI00262665AF|nr:class I SAM-dependent methyltransferase [uncultured Sphingomonas sp.]
MSQGQAVATSGRVTAPPEIFDRATRRRQRDRAAASFGEHDFVRAVMLDGIEERLSAVLRGFDDVLDLGCFDARLKAPAGARVARFDPGYAFARAARGVQGDEDRLPFADACFDLVVAAGTLDTISDLPGAMTLIRRVLRPGGLFLGAFLGAGSLSTLRAVLREAEAERPAMRIHPQVEVRSAGDLLLRTGFRLPVADAESLTVRYATLGRLLDDLRGMAASNVLQDRTPLTRKTIARAATAFAARADLGGRTPERFEIVFLTGWAPAPDQDAGRRAPTAANGSALPRPPERFN